MSIPPLAAREDSHLARVEDLDDGVDLGQECDRNGYAPLKLAVEVLLALVLLVLAAPVLLLCALVVKLTSRGPAFYVQVRVGRYGRPYRIYKLRTMYHDCERLSGPCWSAAGDPRVTPLGRFLRRAHLDELPQLVNVLRGEMSLVGPRPERPEFLSHLERAVPGYRRRLLVRPGVTGLAQVQLPADTSLDSVRDKVAYDLYYVRAMSLWLDLRILAATVFKVFGSSFAFLRAAFGMPGAEEVEGNYRCLLASAPAGSEPVPVARAREVSEAAF